MSYATESHYKTEGSNKTECQIRLKVLREVEPLFLYFWIGNKEFKELQGWP